MNRQIFAPCLFVLALTLIGCKHEPQAFTICLLDISKSITPEGVQDEFKAVDDLADKMHRGDRLILIPITGDAPNEASAHVLSLTVPLHREPYDHDLVVFHQRAHEQIAAMREAALEHPSTRTDILGALSFAKEEFEDPDQDPQKEAARTLIVFSDFIEDDGMYRFASDPALDSEEGARRLAEQLRRKNRSTLHDTRLRLRPLTSTDLRDLTPQRQKAIRAFWSEYLSAFRSQMP